MSSDQSNKTTAAETAAQVTRRAAEAEAALRASETRYRTLFDSIDEGFCVIEVLFEGETAVDYRFIEANPAFVKQTGLANAVGRTMRELAPAHEAYWFEIYGWVALTGKPTRFEAPAEALGRWYDVYAFRIDEPSERRVAVVFADVTTRKRALAALRASDRRHTFMLELSDRLRLLADPIAIQEQAARLLGEHLKLDRCGYFEVDAMAEHITTNREYRAPGMPPFGSHRMDDFGKHLADPLKHGRNVVIDDCHADPATVADPVAMQAFAATSTRAALGVPLLKEDRLVGILFGHQRQPRHWTEENIRLLDAVAERTWGAVERARAEAALRETRRRLDEALATSRMAYWHWDSATDRIVASPSMDEIFGLHAGDSITSSEQLFALVHPEDRAAHRGLVESARARGEGWHAEFRIVRPRDGVVAWVEEVATVLLEPETGMARTTGLVWDITGRKQSEATAEIERAARDRDVLRRQLLEVEEAERRRLARELHDEAGQHLTAIGLGLQALSDVAPPGSEVDRRTADLRALVNAMGKQLHAVAVRLRPKALDDFGLEAAIEAYVEEWSRQTGITIDSHVRTGAERLPNIVEGALYRIVQEALTNVARHSGAPHASVVVERQNGYLVGIVEDDGRGFVPDEVIREPGSVSGFGLLGIRERVALLGGIAEVESAPGAGTTILVRIPIPDSKGNPATQSDTIDV